MAETVINNPTRSHEAEGSAAAAWFLAIVAAGVIIVGAVYLVPRLVQTPAPANTTPDAANINVTIPEGVIPGTNSGGGAGGEQGQNPAPQQQ